MTFLRLAFAVVITAVAMLVPVRRKYAFLPLPAICHDG